MMSLTYVNKMTVATTYLRAKNFVLAVALPKRGLCPQTKFWYVGNAVENQMMKRSFVPDAGLKFSSDEIAGVGWEAFRPPSLLITK